MSLPRTVIYDLPQDRYGRRTSLTGTHEGGQVFWEVRSHPVNQRDEGEVIRGLTTEQLIEIGDAIGHFKSIGGRRG